MLKGIIFDVDNTLVDYMTMKSMASDAAISAMIGAGLEINKSTAREILFDLYGTYGIEDHTIFQKFLLKVTGEIDYKVLSKAIVAYRRMREGFMTPYPFVEETLMKLKYLDLKLAVLSDAPKLKCWMRLAYMNITEYFDAVITFDDTQTHKPAPLPFEMALLRLNLRPDEVLMVGDNRERDVLGAKKLGIKTVHAEYGVSDIKTSNYSHGSTEIKADYNVMRFDKLLELPEVRAIAEQRNITDFIYKPKKFL